jgi:hypothetical protein
MQSDVDVNKVPLSTHPWIHAGNNSRDGVMTSFTNLHELVCQFSNGR